MAGGVGSRFWPASRDSKPKQFLDILGIGKSLIRLTYERFVRIVPTENIYVITNEKYRGLVKQHLPELEEGQIVGEPSRNNTAPCVAYASFKLRALDSNANLLIAPSDHYIHNEEEFIRVVKQGFSFTALSQAILTIGIKPTRPDTGYGYIELGKYYDGQDDIYHAKRFTEKPNLETANTFLRSGNYVWNSGMFFFKAITILEDFQKYAQEIYELLDDLGRVYNTPAEESFIAINYPKTPNISIDYAIMEKAERIYCLSADFGWSDLGTWGSLYDFKDKDSSGNVALSGRSLLNDAQGNLIMAEKNKHVIIKGLDDYYIIDESDILVIWPRSDEDQLTNIRKIFE
jgi:mannose-1-phosphate guanylyltransferase